MTAVPAPHGVMPRRESQIAEYRRQGASVVVTFLCADLRHETLAARRNKLFPVEGRYTEAGDMVLSCCTDLDPVPAWTGVKQAGEDAVLLRTGCERLTRPSPAVSGCKVDPP